MVIFTLHIRVSRKTQFGSWVRVEERKYGGGTQEKDLSSENVDLVPHSSPDRLAQDVFVEGPSKIALQEAVVIYSFGHNASNKLEVAEVVGVAVGRWVDGVGDPITG